MAATVHYLRRRGSPPPAYDQLQRTRAALLAAWSAWLDSQPAPDDVAHEIDATANALRSLADLRGIGRPGTFF